MDAAGPDEPRADEGVGRQMSAHEQVKGTAVVAHRPQAGPSSGFAFVRDDMLFQIRGLEQILLT